MPHAIVLFDGVCNLCTWSVQFILQRDSRGYFRFAAMQSPCGQRLLAAQGLSVFQTSSVVLIEQNTVCVESAAALRIARRLDGWWPGLTLLQFIPRIFRDHLYHWIATHRYQWFGQINSCMVATPRVRERFLTCEEL
jgi:predicted DCC family thiol-disulfide oxidoreductase YuxK